MKILVTGATGFIGRYVVKCLLRTEHEIITTSIEPECDNETKYIPANLSEGRDDWFTYFECPDTVIHLAWEGVSNFLDFVHFEKSLPTSYYFLKNIIESGAGNINAIGSCAEYGVQNGCLPETLTPIPNTPYSIAKNTLRLCLEELKKKKNFDFKWIRPFYMYGEGQGKSAILEQLKSALAKGSASFNMSGGEQLRDYLPVDVVANNIVRISLQNGVQGIINNGSGTPISIRRLVEKYLEQEGANIELKLGYYPYLDHEPFAFWADTTKLKQIIS